MRTLISWCLQSEQPVIVDFWATWCGPCRALAPIVDEVAQSYNGRVKVGKMDVDKNAATPQRYGVRGIPTLLVFKGGQVKEQIVGYVSRDVIEKALEKNLISLRGIASGRRGCGCAFSIARCPTLWDLLALNARMGREPTAQSGDLTAFPQAARFSLRWLLVGIDAGVIADAVRVRHYRPIGNGGGSGGLARVSSGRSGIRADAITGSGTDACGIRRRRAHMIGSAIGAEGIWTNTGSRRHGTRVRHSGGGTYVSYRRPDSCRGSDPTAALRKAQARGQCEQHSTNQDSLHNLPPRNHRSDLRQSSTQPCHARLLQGLSPPM